MKQTLNEDKTIYYNDYVAVRVDKRMRELMGEKPFGRLDPQYWEPQFQQLLTSLSSKHNTDTLEKYIEFITYGQVGSRIYNRKGSVRYIQTINILPTGIDYLIKEAFIEEGSHNDPARSRLKYEDILLGNAGMGGLGKCTIFVSREDKVNISQDIDILRVSKLNPYYLTVFLKSIFGNRQIWVRSKGVGAPKLPFDEIKSIKIALLPDTLQSRIEAEYKKTSIFHDKAMEAKGEGDESGYRKNIEIAETMLKDLISKTEAVIRGEREDVI